MKPPQTPVELFPAAAIAARISALGREIGAAYAGSDLVVVGLLKNTLVFMADLMRAIPVPFRSYTLRVVPGGEAVQGASSLQMLYGAVVPVEGQHVLLLDDILDTGVTLAYARDHIQSRRPSSLRTAVLVDRSGQRKTELAPDWAAFRIEDPDDRRFLVGYGLDSSDYYRGLPFIGTLSLNV